MKKGGLEPLVALLFSSDDQSVLKNALQALNRVRHFVGKEQLQELGAVRVRSCLFVRSGVFCLVQIEILFEVFVFCLVC